MMTGTPEPVHFLTNSYLRGGCGVTARIVSLVNQKGGSGKSTVSMSLAGNLAWMIYCSSTGRKANL